WIETIEFSVDLLLEVAGVGRQPDRATIPLGPKAGGSDVAERLTHSGSSLGQHDLRFPLPLSRRKGRANGRGIVGLLWACFGIGPQDLREPRSCRHGIHREMARRRFG